MNRLKILVTSILAFLFILNIVHSPVGSQELGLRSETETISLNCRSYEPASKIFYVLLPDTEVNWSCNIQHHDGYFRITEGSKTIVSEGQGYASNSFLAKPGVEYKVLVYGGAKYMGDPGGPAYGEVTFTDKVLYRVKCSYEGVKNKFYFYLPADYPQNIIDNPPLARGGKKNINNPTNIKVRNYPVRVWYKFWVSDENSQLGEQVKSKAFFEIQRYHPEHGLGPSLKKHEFYDNIIGGYCDIPANEGIRVTLYNGCWGFSEGYGFDCWYRLTYLLDKTSPDPPSNLSIEGNGVIFDGNQYYTNKNQVSLKWYAPKDYATRYYDDYEAGPSGIKDYLVYKDGYPLKKPGTSLNDWTTATQYELSPGEEEKKYKIQVKARDNENNAGGLSDPIYLVVDRSVGLVTYPKEPVEFRLTGSVKAVTAHWNALDDICGIKEYQVQLMQKTSSGEYEIIEEKKGNMLSQPFSQNLSSRSLYQIKIRAVDRLDNIGNWQNTKGFSPPPSQPENTSVIPIATIINDKPSYKVELTLEDVDAAKYVIERKNVDSSTWEKLTEITYDDLKKASFKYIDADVTKHGNYNYRIYTKNVLGRKSDYSSTETTTIPNILVNLQQLRITAPADGIYTNQLEHEFDISPKKDIEGDELKFSVLYRRTGDSSWKRSGVHTDNINFNFQAEGVWEWYLEIAEYHNNNVISTQKIGDENNPKKLRIDKTRPSGKFEIRLKDGSKSNGFTNNLEVSLFVFDLSDKGNVESGVKGIYLWNGNSETPPSGARFIEYKDIPLEEGKYLEWQLGVPDSEGKCRVNMQVVDNAGNVSDIDEKDDKKDAIYQVIIYDNEKPPAPNYFSHTHREEGGKKEMIFSWACEDPEKDEEDIYEFHVAIGELTTTIKPTFKKNGTRAEGSFAVDVTDKYNKNEFNKDVKIIVTSVDLAGNTSASPYTAYTKAKLGELSDPEQGYERLENGRYNHYLSWEFIDSGMAKEHCLEIATDAGFTKEVQKVDPEGNRFRVDGLAPYDSGKYYYRLVALNQGDDRTEGATVYYEMENNQPEPFNTASLRPKDYAPAKITFTYDEVQDPDGHGLTYKVYYAKGENPTNFAVLEDKNGTGFALNLTEAGHGDTFTWYIEADDKNGCSRESDKVRFRLDARSPELKIGVLERPFGYTNQGELTFLVSDDLSGVASAGFQKTDLDENGNPVSGGGEETIPVQLEPAGDGQYKGVIRLLEGYYNLKIIAWDNAGNDSYVEIKDLRVDQTRPVLGDLQINLPKDKNSERYLAATSELPLTWAATDESSGIKGLHYWFLNKQGKNLGEERFIRVMDPYSEESYNDVLIIPGQAGEDKYLFIAVEDRAGNITEPVSIDLPVLVDTTPPEVALELSGFSSYGGSYYLSDLSNLEVTLKVKEDYTEIAAKEMRLVSSNGEPVSRWETDWSKLQQTKLEAGGSYRIAGRARNAAGGEAEVQSEEFTFDDTVPDKLAITLIASNYPPVPGETVIFKIKAEENDSPITGCRLAVGNSPGGKELTSRIPGQVDGWLAVDPKNLNKEETIRVMIPEDIPDGDYYPFIEVRNAAGLVNTLAGGAFTVKKSPRLLVDDEGPYTAEKDRLSGQWRYTGEEEISYYRYRILGPEDQPVSNWEETIETEVTVTGLELEDGKRYVFEVQAVLAGGEIITGRSLGVVVDTTAPEITTFTTGPYATSWNLRFFWEGRDDESGIASVQAALGSDYHQTDLTGGWVEVNGNHPVLSCDVNGAPLQLVTGRRYYLTLRVMNGAGLITERNSSAIVIDDTPPPEPRIFDQGRFINTKEDQPMEAQWYWTEPDPESGTMSFQWTVTTERRLPENVDWRDGNGMTAVLTMADLPRQHGKTYYFAVKATNGAGLTSIGWSDGITVDASAPYIRRVKLLQAVGDEEEEVRYITHTRDLTLWIDALDPDSGTESYGYAWGLWEELEGKTLISSETPVIELTDFIMPDEEKAIVFFRGTCQNPAGLTADGYSAGVMLETGAPVITGVRGIFSHDMVLLDWEVDLSKSVSPVDHYDVALVRAEDLNSSPAGWKWEKTVERRYERRIHELPEGGYYLVIRGYNKAGVASRRELGEWGISELLIIDYTPPEILAINHDNFVSGTLNAEIQADDNLSGISAYQYALGSFLDHTAYTGGWLDLASRDKRITLNLALDPERIPHGTEVYLAARARDRAGLWSEIKRSNKILVDRTPPSVPVITCGAYTTSDKMIAGIGFESEDPESGVTHYLLSVVKEEGGEWLTAPEPQPIENFNGTLTGLNLEDGGKYRLVMRTMNRAGLWSDPGYSTPVTVDITPPVLEFNREAEKNGELVFNLDELPKVLTYILSEDAQVQFTLLAPNGNLKNFSEEGEAGENTVVFGDEGQYIYGTYLLFARPADLAGNLGERVYQQIRINTPPVIHLQEINTTPGKPLPLQQDGGYVSVYDPDDPDNESFHYEWNMGDGSRPKTYAEALAHYYTAPGDYTLRLTVTDDDGGVSTAETTVHVRNTSQGTLYIDETWSGTHHLYGEVIVPEGVTLTIEPGTRVIIERDIISMGYDYALIVKGALVIPGGEVVIGLPDGETGLWRGIYIEGRAELNGATVKHARRGLTALESSTVNITGCIFRENEVGLHAYGSSPRIIDCSFLENTIYGIKEDKGEGSGGRPVVINCRFGGNRYDYYHQDLAVITLEELNALEGNQGNREQ